MVVNEQIINEIPVNKHKETLFVEFVAVKRKAKRRRTRIRMNIRRHVRRSVCHSRRIESVSKQQTSSSYLVIKALGEFRTNEAPLESEAATRAHSNSRSSMILFSSLLLEWILVYVVRSMTPRCKRGFLSLPERQHQMDLDDDELTDDSCAA